MKLQQQIVVMCMAELTFLTPLMVNAQPENIAKHDRTQTRLLEELGLTTEQKTKIAELHKETRAVREEHVTKIKGLRKQTREELLKDSPSKTMLSELGKEAAELERVYTEKRNEHLLKIKEILTPEQFVKLLHRDRHMRSSQEGTDKRKKRNNNRGAAGRGQGEWSR